MISPIEAHILGLLHASWLSEATLQELLAPVASPEIVEGSIRVLVRERFIVSWGASIGREVFNQTASGLQALRESTAESLLSPGVRA